MEILEDLLKVRIETMLNLCDVLVLLVQGHVRFGGVTEVGHCLRRDGNVVAVMGLDTGHGEDSGPESGDLVLDACRDGDAGGVGHDLTPQLGTSSASHGTQGCDADPRLLLDAIEVKAHLEPDGFEDGAIHVCTGVSSAPTDHGSAGDWIPIRRLHGVPVGEGDEALTARRDGAGSSVELRVWLTEEARVTEGFAEPPGQVGTGRLQDLEDVFAGNSGHQGSYRGVVFVGGGLDTSVHSGAEVEVSNVGG